MVKEELTSIASALVGGARYGAKIRFPHAFVMTFLFRRDLTAQEKLKNILRLVYQHASSLAAFATIYKTVLALLKAAHRKFVQLGPSDVSAQSYWKAVGRSCLQMIVDGPLPGETQILRAAHAPPGHPERIHHAFIAGAVGGYFVWGRYNSLNHQILLYLTSRVLVGVWKRVRGQVKGSASNKTFSLIAALTWAIVMALWEESPEVLHPSLKKSMDEIYRYALDAPKLIFDEVDPHLSSRNIEN